MPHIQASSFNEFEEIVLCDPEGKPMLVIGSSKVSVIGPKGEVSEYTKDCGIRLVDGLLWHTGMLKWANPVLLTTCSICRNPPVSLFKRERATHGLLSVRNARVCHKCGTLVCPQHRRLVEGSWLCISCAKKATLKRLLLPLLFREEG